MCILELKVLQELRFNKRGMASKPIFFLNLNATLLIPSFLCQQTVWNNFTSLIWYFRGILIYMFMNFKTLSSFQRLYIFCCNLLQDILKEWDYELAWHEQEARRNKLLRILWWQEIQLCKKRIKTFPFPVRKMMTTKREMPNVKSCYWQQWSEIECRAKSTKV